MSGPDGSSIKRKIRCAAGMHGRSLAYCVPPMVLYVERRVRVFQKNMALHLAGARKTVILKNYYFTASV